MPRHVDPAQSIYGREGNPLEYPSTLESIPYLLHGRKAFEIDSAMTVDLAGSRRMSLDAALTGLGAAPTGERIAQIAFGANRDLENLAWKLEKYGSSSGQQVSRTVVVIPASVPDAAVVACNIGYWGYVYAALLFHRPPELDRPYLEAHSARVAVLLLDRSQMEAMHASEGVPRIGEHDRQHVSCDVAVTSANTRFGSVEAQMYALPLPFLSFDRRHPIGFCPQSEPMTRSKPLQRMTQVQMFDRLATELAIRTPQLGTNRMDGEALAAAIRGGAFERVSGGDGSKDRSQELYEACRSLILSHLTLVEESNQVRTGSDALPGQVPPDEYWRFFPLAEFHRKN